MIHKLNYQNKEIILLGTAHVSRESVKLVIDSINMEKPDTVCVELCESRFQAIRQRERWQDMDIVKVIKEKKSFLLLANLLLASFQKRIAKKLGINPGEEMLKAIETGEAVGAAIHLADRDIRTTLARTWRAMSFLDKIKLIFQILLSASEIEDIKEEDVEKMKNEDMLESLLSEIGKSLPALKKILIDERNDYIAYKIRTAPGEKIVAVVGAGHVPGIKAHIHDDIDIQALEELPPKTKLSAFLKWILPAAIFSLFILGFFYGGSEAGTDMILWWILAHGLLAGLGAVIALAHPLTVLSAVVAAPITALNPMIAAGWVAGLVEALSRKPKVRDLENLPEDILSFKGFWKNKVTRILLVVVFANIGSSIGTFISFPFLLKVLQNAI